MFCLRKPSQQQVQDYLSGQANAPYSYEFPGCTRDSRADRRGWNIDHHRVVLGHGSEAFARARAAIDTWQMFPSEITKVFSHGVPRENLLVAILYRVSVFPLGL